MVINEYCKHCWPTKRKKHLVNHINYYIDKSLWSFCVSLGEIALRTKVVATIADLITTQLVELLALIGIIKFQSNPDETKLYNRGLIFFKEAKKRGLTIQSSKFLGKYNNSFKFIYKGKKYYYDSIPLTILDKHAATINNKGETKRLLKKYNIPVAEGKSFTNKIKAIQYARNLGFPLVVKPNNGSLSHHVTCNIQSDGKLIEAINIVKKFSPDFIVEKYIKGELYRATVIGKKHLYICKKEKANVIGDGLSTIKELITFKNSCQERGKTHKMNTTLHEILIDEVLKTNLKNQNLDLQSIIAKNKKIYLQNKYILAHGCDIINCGEQAHTQNKRLFFKIANLFDTNLIGIDFISPNIKTPYYQHKVAVLEANSLPYLDMHQYPSHGKPEQIARAVWDITLDHLDKK
ncbi:hypothetical protein ISS03_02635 [Patescibacteria group bacterium]|nr:hypothetical protein [Patescibacteria group bacterium]